MPPITAVRSAINSLDYPEQEGFLLQEAITISFTIYYANKITKTQDTVAGLHTSILKLREELKRLLSWKAKNL